MDSLFYACLRGEVVDRRGTAVQGRSFSRWSACYVRNGEAFSGGAPGSRIGWNKGALRSVMRWHRRGKRGQKKKASGGGRLSCCGVFPIRPEVACSNFARFQNNKIFTQAAQWRFTGNLIRRNDRRWDQPAKIAVAKNPNRHQDRQDTHTLLHKQNRNEKCASVMAALPPNNKRLATSDPDQSWPIRITLARACIYGSVRCLRSLITHNFLIFNNKSNLNSLIWC
jgi:hypothetical protein